MKLLLDTNSYSDFMRGDEQVANHIRAAELVYMSPFVVGELLFGFRNGQRFEANQRKLQAFLESPVVQLLPVTMTTSDRYSRIAAALRVKGKPIPTNDIWIAAHAMETGADLLSRDKHFAEVDGLALIAF